MNDVKQELENGCVVIGDVGEKRIIYPKNDDGFLGGYTISIGVSDILSEKRGKMIFRGVDEFNEVREHVYGFDVRRICDPECGFSLTHEEYKSLSL